MKDKILLFWNTSSYLRRSIILYSVFSILAIVSKLLNDSLGFLSSMIAIGFLISMIGVVASIVYALVMGINGKTVIKESFFAILVLILFLFLMSLIPSIEKKEVLVEKKKTPESTIHHIIELPTPKN